MPAGTDGDGVTKGGAAAAGARAEVRVGGEVAAVLVADRCSTSASASGGRSMLLLCCGLLSLADGGSTARGLISHCVVLQRCSGVILRYSDVTRTPQDHYSNAEGVDRSKVSETARKPKNTCHICQVLATGLAVLPCVGLFPHLPSTPRAAAPVCAASVFGFCFFWNS